jgi:dephospho-CoA kinase
MFKKIIIGVTGEIKAGKTTVVKIFQDIGTNAIYSDDIVHEFLRKDKKLMERIREEFGNSIFKNNVIARELLAKEAFCSKRSWRKLNYLIHPLVIDEIKRIIKKSKKKYQVIDAPLLFESKLNKICDYIIVVKSNIDLRKKRKGKLTWSQVVRREEFLKPLGEKEKESDFVIENNFSFRNLEEKVKEIFEEIRKYKKAG